MTMHYHGTPITPRSVLDTLSGRNFCVSYAEPRDVQVVHRIGQSVMLDNGAYTFWKQNLLAVEVGWLEWRGYYEWCEPWLDYPTTWAVIPDVIDGDEDANDQLLRAWFQTRLPRGAPVWHMHESLERLRRLCHGYERVCVGSSGQYATVGTDHWHRRLVEVFNTVWEAGLWLHMLRGMSLAGDIYPFASLDSTDVARNHNRDHNTALKLAARWDALQCPAHWTPVEQARSDQGGDARMTVEFVVHGKPAPAGSKRGFYNAKARRVIVTDDSKNSRPWKALVSDAAVLAMGGSALLEGPLMLGLEFYFPRPKGHYGVRGLRPSAPPIPTVKPDLLKLARAVEDALTGIVYRDDAQIAREVLDKFYGEPARVEVRIRVLDCTNSEIKAPAA